MEYMQFFAYIIEKEMERFYLDLDACRISATQLSPTFDANFDNAYNRCAFLYRNATCNMVFFKNCVSKFLTEYPGFSDIVLKWKSVTDIRLCSLSCGPGLDYLSFMHALSDNFNTLSFKNKTIISKHGAWQSTINFVSDGILKGYLTSLGSTEQLNYQNVELIQADVLRCLHPKAIAALQDSQVVLMMKSLNLTSESDQEEMIINNLKDLIFHLKTEALIFCIDTKPSLSLLVRALRNFPGRFLYGPQHLNFRLPTVFPEEYREKHGCFPVVGARGTFFVWQKMSSYELHRELPTSPCPLLQAVGGKSKNEEMSFSSGDTAAKPTSISQSSFESVSSDEETASNITKLQKNIKIPDFKSQEHHLIASAIKLLLTSDKIESDSASSNSESCHEMTRDFQGNAFNHIESSLGNQYSKQSIPEVCSLDAKSSSSVSFSESSSAMHNNYKCLPNLFPYSEVPLSNTDDRLLNVSPFQEKQSESVKKKEAPANYCNKVNNMLKPPFEFKTVQTDSFVKEEPSNSISSIRILIERIGKLVSSFERELEVSNNSCDGHMYQCPLNIPNECANAPSTSANYCDNNNYSDVKSSCSSVNLPSEHVPSHCSFAQINNCHCCTNRLNLNHGCEMQLSHGSCIPRCCPLQFCRPHCENTLQNSAMSNLVIPLQNLTEDAIPQIISAAKMISKPN